jgi:predicted metalloprotease with PDZ domain
MSIRHLPRHLRIVALLPVLACAGRTTTPATSPSTGAPSALANAGIGPLASDRADVPARPYDIAYTIAFPDPASHLYEITLDVARLDGSAPLTLQLPVWNPGRYARIDFARNVQDFAATGPDGRAIRWEKTGGSTWQVHRGGAERVRVRYRVFANNLSGTYSVLDTLHANWNGGGLFMYVAGHKPDPVTMKVVAPAGWQLMNGDARDIAQRDFRFANYDLLVDTPTEVAPALAVDTFRVDGILYRVVTHHNGDDKGQRARFVDDHRKIVTYENRVFGPPPIPMYTFLQNIGFQGGDGMEHLNSTQIANPRPWSTDDVVLPGVGTAAHEYFHVWNVKRVRPAALGPFDYTQAIHQPSLWVAEGWTNYYGNMALHRAGVVDRAALYRSVSGVLTAHLEHPARKERSARQASFDAPFFDGGVSPMLTNARNTFFSYYVKGEGLALALDLMIRARSGGAKSLDDVARTLRDRTWNAPADSYYLQGRGYTEADVERAASDVYGSDLHDWFERHVGGVEEVDFTPLLRPFGLVATVATVENGARRWTVGESADATAEQVRLRDGWLAGR